MTDPIKQHETITINICDVCGAKYSYEEAKKRDMSCCGKPLRQHTERVPIPLGP